MDRWLFQILQVNMMDEWFARLLLSWEDLSTEFHLTRHVVYHQHLNLHFFFKL